MMDNAPEEIWANVEDCEDGTFIEFLSDEPFSKDNPGVKYLRWDIHGERMQAVIAEREEARSVISKMLDPDIVKEAIMDAEIHPISHEDIEDTVRSLKVRMLVALNLGNVKA